VAVALSLAFGFIKLFGLPVGSVDSKAYDALPTWVLLVVIIRAGFVEELFYRGYAIERLQSLTGSLIFAAGIPLVIFAVSHYRQGQAGIIIAMLTGAVLTGVYVYKAKPLDHDHGAFPRRFHPEYSRAPVRCQTMRHQQYPWCDTTCWKVEKSSHQVLGTNR
jgi:hypothetical protein